MRPDRPTPVPNADAPAERGLRGAPLAALEHWFQAVITDPVDVHTGLAGATPALLAAAGSAARGAPADAIVTPGPRLSATERLAIYHHAYHARLVECLADDYPTVEHALGGERFAALARRYIAAHPSTSPNLNGFGRHLASFLRTQGDAMPDAAFAADLATLEWAMVEVVHAAGAPALSLDRLHGQPPEQFGGLRFVASPSLRFHEFGYPVNRYLQAVRQGEAPAIPAQGWSATAIYRQGYTTWRMDFTPAMAGVLEPLLRGETLGAALDTLSGAVDRGFALEGDVMAWFRAWVEGGFFADVIWSGDLADLTGS